MLRLIALLLVLAVGSSCISKKVDSELIQSIPDGSKVIIALDDLEDLNDLLANNPLYDQIASLQRLQELKKISSFLKDYELSTQSFLALSMEGKNKAVITLLVDEADAPQDSIRIVSKKNYNDVQIIERRSGNGSYFTAVKDGTHIASSSILVVESLIRRPLENYVFDDSFVQLFERTHKDLSIYINATDDQWLYQFLLGKNKVDHNNHAQWYQIEPSMDATAIYMEGLVVYKDSLKQKQAIYNNLDPQENKIAGITPASFLSIKSVSYTDADVLLSNLRTFKGNAPVMPALLKEALYQSTELSSIRLEKGTGLIFSLLPEKEDFINLDSLSTAKITYRDQPIYTLPEQLNTKSLHPITVDYDLHYVSIVDDYMILTQEQATMELILASFKNGTTLANQNWWKQASKNMSTSSTVLNVTGLEQWSHPYFNIDPADQKILENIDRKSTKAVISQYVHEDGYAFYRMEIPIATTVSDQPLVAQKGSFKTESPIIAGPFLFENHLNNTHDVVIQTEDLELKLISENGSLYWSKKLDSPIIGGINKVDVYKNGRYQLLFNTSSKVYLLDRNGNNVEKYPYKAPATITQPMSVFDYDNNRNYRFVITLKDDLLMLDSSGSKVNGFDYSPSGVINNSPIHVRKGKKDYIAFTTAQGRFMLLNRTGDVRTKVKKPVDVVGGLYFQNNLITAMTNDQKIVHVDPTTGTVTPTKFEVTESSRLAIGSGIQLIQNNESLLINNKEVELPYGSYTPAQITTIKNKVFISLVETGENKVYLLDNDGNILPFFPVYGSKNAAIAGAKTRTLTTCDNQEVLIYKW